MFCSMVDVEAHRLPAYYLGEGATVAAAAPFSF
jgi:hypothetical protein